MSSITVVRTVSVPEDMLDEWVTEPSKGCSDQYTAYFKAHTLEAESEGWTSYITRLVTKSTLSVLGGLSGCVLSMVTKNDGLYLAAGRVVQKGHQYYVSKTRLPVEHSRVEAVVAKIAHIQKCTNADALLKRVQAVYNKGYFSSHGSHALIQVINSEVDMHSKFEAVIAYLQKPATVKDHTTCFYNNGKWLYQVIVCLTEKSEIKSPL